MFQEESNKFHQEVKQQEQERGKRSLGVPSDQPDLLREATYNLYQAAPKIYRKLSSIATVEASHRSSKFLNNYSSVLTISSLYCLLFIKRKWTVKEAEEEKEKSRKLSK